MRNFLRTEILVLLAVTVLVHPHGLAQTADPVRIRSFSEDVSQFVAGIGRVYVSPLQWQGEDWLDAAGVGALAGAAFLLDDESRALVGRSRSGFGDDLSEVGNTYGEAPYALVLAAGMYTAGLLTSTEWIRGTGFTWLQTLVSAGGVNLVLKTLVGRSRPYLNRGNHDFDFWSWKEESLSFPSGHTVVAFSLSSVLAARLKNPWATAVLYGLAGITAWSRMYTDDHWLSDVAFGAAFTAAIGTTLVRRYEGTDDDTDSGSGAGVLIGPTAGGVTLRIVF